MDKILFYLDMLIFFGVLAWMGYQMSQFCYRAWRAKKVDNNDVKRTTIRVGLASFILGLSFFAVWWIGSVYWRSDDIGNLDPNSWLWGALFCLLGWVAIGLLGFYVLVLRVRAEYSPNWNSRNEY